MESCGDDRAQCRPTAPARATGRPNAPPPRSPRPVGGADAGGDEDRSAGCARRDIGGVPRPRRVDRVIARRERHALGAAVGMFLVERAGALGADHEFRAVRVHLPRVPALGKGELRDQPALQPVRCMAGGIGLEPVGAGEVRLDGGTGAAAEMGGVGGEVGHGYKMEQLSRL